MLFAALADTFNYLWLGWIVLFAFIEVIALRLAYKKGRGDYTGYTLSELIWRVTKNPIVYVAFAGLWVVLGFHFFIDR